LRALVSHARQQRWAQLVVVGLRLFVGFAFVPAGLKKLLGEPFTDPTKTGPFYEFLHAFHATGAFYSFVGLVQLFVAVLLMTQAWALLGALLALPIITAITVFCWSTSVIPTAIVASLMWLGIVALLVWDFEALAPLLRRADTTAPPPAENATPTLIDLSVWRRCGAGILTVYGASCLFFGGVYRPKGVDLNEPAFYVLPLILLLPAITLAWEQRRRKSTDSASRASAATHLGRS